MIRSRSVVLVVFLSPMLLGWSFFDPFHKSVERGNQSADEENPEEALRQYQEASKVDPSSPIPDFNSGIVHSNEGNAEAAGDAFLGAAASKDPSIAADALYNLGNVLLEAEQYAPSVEAYLKSLDLDPADSDARRNLEIAFRRAEEQQQQQQQQQENKQSDSEEKKEEEKDQQQDQRQEPQEPQDSQNESPQSDENQTEEQQPPEAEPPPDRMSPEDAERLLNAIESDELRVLQQLQQNNEETRGAVANDW